MYCKRCGTQLQSSMLYCPKCGTRLDGNDKGVEEAHSSRQRQETAAFLTTRKKDDQCRKIDHSIHSHFIDNIYM